MAEPGTALPFSQKIYMSGEILSHFARDFCYNNRCNKRGQERATKIMAEWLWRSELQT